jgi:steroid 5-alpha reductase family enzyme
LFSPDAPNIARKSFMKNPDHVALICLPIVILIAVLVAIAGSQNGAMVNGIPLLLLLVGLAFVVQWLAFIPAYFLQTEKFFDITGGLTYIAVVVIAAAFSSQIDARSILLLVLVVVWALRLGSFLFMRIHKAGKDGRFDDIKPSFIRFLNVWTIQGLWVTLTAIAALVAITTSGHKALDGFALGGFLLWLLGFALEVVADGQKTRFNANPANHGKFIQSGLWARSRHPNYFGEMLLWFGVAIIALPVLQGWQWVALISPFFVTLLLTKVSGIPMLEKRADAKWGGQADYEAYKNNTPVLIPRW